MTQTSRAALFAAAMMIPVTTLPGLAAAQTPPPPADAAAPDAPSPEGHGAASGGGTAHDGTMAGGAAAGGSAAQSGSSADTDLSYERVVADLLSGRDFGDQLEGLDRDTSVTVTGLGTLRQVSGGAVATAEEGTPPMTGGQTTVDATGGAMAQSDSASGASAAGAPDAPAGISDGAATGGGTQSVALSAGDPADIDAALDQGAETLSALRTQLADQEAVTEALASAGHTVDDVIALHRDEAGLTVVVDDRDS